MTTPEAEQSRPEERLEQAVRAAEQALIEFEIAVETFRVEVENFSRLHHQRLGPMYARLDELEAEIAEARAARSGDPEDARKAAEARARVLPMPGVEELFHGWMDGDGLFPEAAAMLTDQSVRPPERVRPSDEARKLYRELARKAHPDLAQEEAERTRREEFITRVNAAYARGDEALLRELAEEWAAGPAPAERRPSPSEELYARLEWLSARKEMLSALARELEESAIGSMLRMAPEDPDRLLEEIAEQLLTEVAKREGELAELAGSGSVSAAGSTGPVASADPVGSVGSVEPVGSVGSVGSAETVGSGDASDAAGSAEAPASVSAPASADPVSPADPSGPPVEAAPADPLDPVDPVKPVDSAE